ncbi:polyketide synthase [Aspergillus sclerotioniger CBS 115572]|uniref:Polyketide synthase n=1 Tax=Aspergillus sclerotioniger CBS 115572 TaxID=1450535 RepID=A0A317W7G8_9EURO|nr:polyketide synthase [Aspergillus sclerotioniger CBS 115572]PWY81621.1 polyketide synthase [Aspergillus sclerotioniger CBS 115572]
MDHQHDHGLQNEPIAVVGMGCRLPGNVSSPSELWDFLIQNKSGHCHVPKDRYNTDAFYHPDVERPGSINSTGGYFIQEDIRAFDNAFFGINNPEARDMDPQQRKLLEVVYEAFENAGVPQEHLQGSQTGVFVGNFTNDHLIMQLKDPEYVSRYSATGLNTTILANRITHSFDLHGPSLTVDTACSASLYAFHLACLSLDAHDCTAAIVASANLIQSPEQQISITKAGTLSPDSVSHTFDESANGYGRAEAVSAVYLKRLGDAVRDKDPIRSIIRGTATNGNGRTSGIFQPSIKSQKAVIRAAYRRAGLVPDETDYIEAHGTGTKVGDPMEIEAITGVFCHKTGRPTLVGGVKPALGHSEAATGLTSVMKVSLALEHGLLPATIGVNKINPAIKTDEWNVDIVTSNKTWPTSAVPRAGINASGFGGSNSHAILEAAQVCCRSSPTIDETTGASCVGTRHSSCDSGSSESGMAEHDRLNLILLSAKSQASLAQMAHNLATYTAHPHRPVSLNDLAFTLGCRRSRFDFRGFFLESQSRLDNGLDTNALKTGHSDSLGALPFAFIYTGQGSQWAGMGKELLKCNYVFRHTIEYLDFCLHALDSEHAPPWSIEATFLAPAAESDINSAEKSQSICTAVQIALTDLLRDWGVLPEIVVGHSSGEIGAAYAAGFLSAREAILTSYFRGRIVSECPCAGAMVTAGLQKSEAETIIEELVLQGKLQVACINSPESTTISGDEEAIDHFASLLQERGIMSKKLRTGGNAYHSHHMKEIGSRYQSLLKQHWNRPYTIMKGVTASTANVTRSVTMISTVTGEEAKESEVAMSTYWRFNLESPVRFSDALWTILQRQSYHFIEIGPHSTLKLPLQQTAVSIGKSDYLYDSAFSRGKDSWMTMLQLIGSLFLQGHDELNYRDVIVGEAWKQPCVCIDLPPYPWDYDCSAMWSVPRMVTEFCHRKYPRHDLLGSRVPGVSPATAMWRNLLDLNEVEWLSHHCLGPYPIFPAAGYIAMAVEAIRQVSGLELDECPGIELRNLNFLKTLDLDPNQKPRVEVLAEMSASKISSLATSNKWWDFSVLSVTDDDFQATKHMSGIVSLAGESPRTARQINLDKSKLQKDASRVWYERFIQEGLNWGPSFSIMKEIFRDRARMKCAAAATTPLLRGSDPSRSGRPEYIVHPISMDGMFQTAFVATSGGWINQLRAKLPVAMDSLYIAPTSAIDMSTENIWSTDGVSESVGFGAVRINAELYNSSGQVLARMNNARCITFQGKSQTDTPEERNPLVRVAWKPDITLTTSPDISTYLDWFADICRSQRRVAEEHLLRLAGALDLICHKRPDSKVLDLTNQTTTAELMRTLLRAHSPLRRFDTYFEGSFSESGELLGKEAFTEEQTESKPSQGTMFDVLIIDLESDALISKISPFVSPGAMVITTRDVPKPDVHFETVITDKAGSQSMTISKTPSAATTANKAQTRHVVMITRDDRVSDMEVQIQQALEHFFGFTVNMISLFQVSEETVPKRAIVVSSLELRRPLLIAMDEHEIAYLKDITDRAAIVLWLSNGDMLGGQRPDFAPVLGLSRCSMLGQPSLRFAVLNIDDVSIPSSQRTPRNTVKIMHQLIHTGNPDLEFAQKKGTIHIARWEPDEYLNTKFRLKQNEDTIDKDLGSVGRCELGIKSPGQMDTIHFVRKEHPDKLPPDEVEVEVKCVGLNAKDLYVLTARVDTKNATCSCECAGVITAVGDNVFGFNTGDRVVAMGPAHFANIERFPQWALCKLSNDENFTTASTIPIVFSTVLYALKYMASIQPGESILIHSAAGGVGMAAIQYAKHVGAKIFATVGNEKKRTFLVKNFGLDASRIFSSRDTSFLPAVLDATSGQGVDVVLNSLSGELLHSSFSACAGFGRFIEIGKRDILDHGALDMSVFARSVSFMAFDLADLYLSKKQAHHELWRSLLMESMRLIRSGICRPCFPIDVFDVSEITDAFRHLSLGSRIGKVAVSFQNAHSRIRVIPDKHEAAFDPHKSYLMVGCLGGLGRSLSKWMVSRGARSFVFLGRSGDDKPEARTMVDDLREQGSHVVVTRGDVCKYDDVEKAVCEAISPIGGVMQAAMALSEALWVDMSREQWHTTLSPKVQGTWNLHNALRKENRDSHLDFFVMTSSTSGTVGTPTEANYSAANAFLDAFARYRNSLGLPAVAIGYGMLSGVGYLHEHPEIESYLKRAGAHAITEDELIQIMDLAITHQDPATWESRYDQLVGSHLLTGVEFIDLQKQHDQGFEGDNPILSDPRASLFSASFARKTGKDINANTTPAGNNRLPEEVITALRGNQSSNSTSVLDALRGILSTKISHLILLPEGKLQPDQPLGEFGLDSMLAAELRTFIFRRLDVDVPFVVLMNSSTTVDVLARRISEGLEVDVDG